MERPKSPRTTLVRNTPYCTGSGRWDPRSRRTRGIAEGAGSGGRGGGAGAPASRITTKTTVETSHSAISARKIRWPTKGRNPRMGSITRLARGSESEPGGGALRASELEVEAPDLELLVRVRRPFHVFLQPVVLVGLDHWEPREVLEEDLRHLLVGLAPDLLVHREARSVAQLVELRISPVVRDAARTEQPPHHPVGVSQRRSGVRPPHALEALLPV